MKSSMILGAVCALGAMAEVQPSYVTEWTTTTVTDWTVVTITKTVTLDPTTAAESTTTVEPIIAAEPTTTTTSAPETQVKVKESTADAVESTTTVETTSSVAPEQPVASTWSTTEASTESTTEASTESATQTTTESTAAASATQAPASGYQSNVLFSHNVHRANHSSTDLSWSSDLQASAQTLAARCVYEHDTSINGGGYGQNIGYGTSADEVAVMISNLMYNDEMGYFENLYGQANPDMSLFEKWGHFSQIVWKGTTHVGCATVSCDSLGNVDAALAVPFTVCNYSPPGNYDGEYADNVLEPLGQASYTA